MARDLDTRSQIHDLVVRFYRDVVFDDLLAPVFEEVAGPIAEEATAHAGWMDSVLARQLQVATDPVAAR